MIIFILFQCNFYIFFQLSLLILVLKKNMFNPLFIKIYGHNMIFFLIFNFSIFIN